MNMIGSSYIAAIIFFTTILVSLYALFINRGIYDVFILKPWAFVKEKKYYMLLTSGLIHADLRHLLFNMMTFFFFAFQLESIVGHFRFFVIYFLGLILSDITTIVKYKDDKNYGCLGASGAISAVLFSYIIYNPFSRIYIMFIPFGIPAFLFAVLYLIYCMYSSRSGHDNINHDAHFLGAIIGVITTFTLDPGKFVRYVELLFSSF